MQLALKVKLGTTEQQFGSLKKTMERFNEACNYIANTAFNVRTANKIKLQKMVYYDVKERFKLSAQMVVRAIAKVCEVYKRDKDIKPVFKPFGAVVYDQRILSWKGLDLVSILTVDGRMKIPTILGDYHKARLDRIKGQADLILIKDTFYLCPIVDVPEPERIKPTSALGIDLGIVNIATDSDGETHTGKQVNTIRSKHAKLRSNLQGCGSRSAKRHLNRLSGKERRFATNINHIISKRIVSKAKDTGRGIALEDLTGIRNQTTVRKAQRRQHNSWGFRQLRNFIEYKAILAGVPVFLVNPRGTSHICPKCGINERGNRPSRDKFVCSRCGLRGPADHIAAINIAARANVNTPIVPEDFRHFQSPLGTSPHALAVGC
jgi:IS605 OrfB family transposase